MKTIRLKYFGSSLATLKVDMSKACDRIDGTSLKPSSTTLGSPYVDPTYHGMCNNYLLLCPNSWTTFYTFSAGSKSQMRRSIVPLSLYTMYRSPLLYDSKSLIYLSLNATTDKQLLKVIFNFSLEATFGIY